MQLYLDSFGAYLFVRNGMFAVRTRAGGERAFALRSVGAVLLTKGTALSADAALLAAEHDIPVVLIDADTHFPLAQVSSGRAGSHRHDPQKPGFVCPLAAGFCVGGRTNCPKNSRPAPVVAGAGRIAGGACGFRRRPGRARPGTGFARTHFPAVVAAARRTMG